MGITNLYSRFLRRTLKVTFPLWERLGFHVTPCHYYEPVPVVKDLDPGTWKRRSELPGIRMNEEGQLAFLETVCAPRKAEYDQIGLHGPTAECAYFVHNGHFGEADGDVLHSVIRHFKPRRIVEVGSGWSTLLSEYSLAKNRSESGVASELTAIEPYPRPFLLERSSAGAITLIRKKIQEVNLDLFATLEENDILFIDSSHVVSIGSDVNREFLEILPRLKKGVLVHVHDIFLPDEYPESWVKKLRIFWNEAYLLQAFLAHNSAFEVVWAGYWMKVTHPEKCRSMFRSAGTSSFWIRKVA